MVFSAGLHENDPLPLRALRCMRGYDGGWTNLADPVRSVEMALCCLRNLVLPPCRLYSSRGEHLTFGSKRVETWYPEPRHPIPKLLITHRSKNPRVAQKYMVASVCTYVHSHFLLTTRIHMVVSNVLNRTTNLECCCVGE